MITLALAQEIIVSPLPLPSGAPQTPDQIIALLADSLALAKGLPAALGAIFIGIVALAMAMLMIAKYFAEKGKREDEAYKTDLRIKTEQATNLARIQKDAATSLATNLDLAYKQDYEYFVVKIKAEKYDAVCAKIAPKFHVELSKFIYDTALPAEERAARIIMVIKPQ